VAPPLEQSSSQSAPADVPATTELPRFRLSDMPRRWTLWALFLSSYAPLFVLVAIRSIGTSRVLAITSAALALLGLAGTLIFLLAVREKPAGIYDLLEVENRDPDVAAYAATYLLPFLTVFSGTWQDLASLAGFVLILGIVYVRSRLIYINPLLSLLGFRLWRVIPITAGANPPTTAAPWPRFLLTRHSEMKKQMRIEAWRATPDLLILKKVDSDDIG